MLLLHLLVDLALARVWVIFLELNFALNLFLVFAGIIILPFADGAAKGDKIVRVFDLCHSLR